MALVLSVGAFVFVGREARAEQVTQAQQQRTTAIQYAVVVDGKATETVGGTPTGDVFAGETSPANTSPVGPAPPVGSAPSGNSAPSGDPAPPGNSTSPVATMPQASEQPMAEPAPRSDPVPSDETGPAPPTDSTAPIPGPAPQPEPTPPVDPAPASEEAPTSGPIVPDSVQEEPYRLSISETVESSMVETESTASVVGNLADGSPSQSAEDEGAIVALFVNSFSGREAGLAPVGGHAEDPGSPSGGAGEPSNGTPQPSSPFAPPLTPPAGGSSFSLSGGQVGPGGVAPLLLCILILGLVLLRRDRKLSRAFCELPKPSSVLLLPLERPG